MTLLSQQSKLQASFFAQMARDSLRTGSTPSTKIVLRHIKSTHDSATQILNELGTTDVAIGDATAEIMITTLGKIPNEMYYLEDTTPGGKVAAYDTQLHTMLDNDHTKLVSIETEKSEGYMERSTLLLVLLTALLIILLLCCITACIIAKSKSKHTLFTRSDVECSPECSGVNLPLLGLDKTSDTTSKVSSTN